MKKLFMSMVALTVMSSAAFADSGEKAAAEKSVNTITVHKMKVGTNVVHVTEEVKQTQTGNAVGQTCVYTLRVYNSSGQLTTTHNHSYELGAENGYGFSWDNCGAYFKHMRTSYMHIYQAVVYNVG